MFVTIILCYRYEKSQIKLRSYGLCPFFISCIGSIFKIRLLHKSVGCKCSDSQSVTHTRKCTRTHTHIFAPTHDIDCTFLQSSAVGQDLHVCETLSAALKLHLSRESSGNTVRPSHIIRTHMKQQLHRFLLIIDNR